MKSTWPGASEEQLREDIARTSQAVFQQGWVANHDGNVSARLSPTAFLCTPTAMSKADITAACLLVVDESGTVVSGSRRVFSEFQLHKAAFAARPDIGVVLHAHPPVATAFAVSHVVLDPCIMAEPIVSIGTRIPLVPFFPPGDARLVVALSEALAQSDVVMLANHGILTVGGNCEQARLRMELVEHLARITHAARALGGPKPLPASDVSTLSAKGRPKSEPDFSAAVAPKAPPAPVWGTPQPPALREERPNVGSLVEDALRRFR